MLVRNVATALTACGIETDNRRFEVVGNDLVATALTACGIETYNSQICLRIILPIVATALTACGIETQPYHHLLH